MKKHLYVVMFLLAGISMFSQDCNLVLTGRVIDFHDGVPLKGAEISFNNQKIITNEKGEYRIENLCNVAYAFTVAHKECNTQVVTVDMSEKSKYDFYLEHHYTDLEEVDIIDSSKKTLTNSQTEGKLNKEQLEEYSNLSLGDALKEISGVSSLNTGNTIVKPVIQGLHSSRIVIMNNGVRQEDQEWGEEHAPNIDLNTFDELRVIKGAGALQYGGDAIGGIVIGENKLTTLRDTIFGKVQVSASSNGRGGSTNGVLNIGFKNNWSTKIQGTLKHYGDSEAPEYVLSNTGIREQSFSIATGYNTFEYGIEGYYSLYNAKQGILRASHIGNRSDLFRAIESDEPLIINSFTYDINAPRQETQHHLAKLKYYQRFKNAGKLVLQYAFQYNNRKEFDIRRGDDRNKASLDLELFTHTLEGSFVFDAKDTFKKTIGIQASTQENVPNPDTGVRRLIPDYLKNELGAFATFDFEINDKLRADAGIRYDYTLIDADKFYEKDFWDERGYNTDFPDLIIGEEGNQWLTNPNFDYHAISGALGINYEIGNKQWLTSNISYANRAPNPAELFSDGLHHSAAIIELGDLRIEQEKALKWGASYQHNNFIFNNAKMTIAPHASWIKDFIVLEPIGFEETTRGAFPVWEYKQTNATLYGVDIDYHVPITNKWNIETGFSYIYGQDEERERPLIHMPSPNFSTTFSYEEDKWNVRLVNTTTLKQTRYPDNNFTESFLENGVLVDRIVDISTPPDGYTVFDLHGAYKLSLWNPEDFTIGLSITNLFDTQYRDYLNRQRYYADNVGRNFTINLKLKL